MNKKSLLLFFLFLPYLSPGQIAFLDSTFDNDGIVTTDITSDDDGAQGMVLQPDGKIIVAGTSTGGLFYVITLARYNINGSLDSSFGLNGKVITDIGNWSEGAHALLLQSDGKIVIAGGTFTGSHYNFVLVRYQSDGSPDSAFGSNGIVVTGIGSYGNTAVSIVQQADGKLIAAGYATNVDNDFALVRYLPDGSPDSSFGTNGIITTDIGSGDNDDCEIVLQPDGKIVLAGSVFNGNYYDFALARYNSDGTLDNSFGNAGKVITDFYNYDDYAITLALQADGKIIVAGYTSSNGTKYDFGLARYKTNGSLDNSFGVGGKVITDVSDTMDMARSILILGNGKFFVAGTSGQGTTSDFELVGYREDGSVDSSFNINGIFKLTLTPESSWLYTLKMQSDGKILLSGATSNGTDNDYLVVRLLNNLSVIPNSIGFSAGDITLCKQLCTGFFDESTNNPTSWYWHFPGGIPSYSTDQNPTKICYSDSGTYDVTLVTTHSNTSDTLTFPKYMVVYPQPQFPTITQSGNTLFSSAAPGYQWQFNSVDIPGATSQSCDLQQTGNYTVIITNENGCTSSSTIYVVVTDVDEVNPAANITIHPNPSSGIFILEYLNFSNDITGYQVSTEASINVFNVFGRKVFSSEESRSIGTSGDWKKSIDLSREATGIYSLELKTSQCFFRNQVLITQ